MQTRTSKNTDINGRQGKLPRPFSLFEFSPGQTVFDYGCGRETELVRSKVEEQGAIYIPYDKYHESAGSLEDLEKGVDVVVCSNVLNVIDDDETILVIIKRICNNCHKAIFKVYEKNGDSKGNESGNDQWQTNYPLSWYTEKMIQLGFIPREEKGCLVWER